MVRTKVVTVMSWYAHDEVNQEESERNEVDGMKKGAEYLNMWPDTPYSDSLPFITAIPLTQYKDKLSRISYQFIFVASSQTMFDQSQCCHDVISQLQKLCELAV